MSRIGLIVLLALLVVPALAQEQRPGVGNDARGTRFDDPSENAKALSAADSKRQDDLRNLEVKFLNAMREKEAEVSKVARDAETRRINDLSAQKQLFDLELARVLKANVESSALLLSTQVKELKTDSNDRMSKLEQFRYESSGRGTAIGDAAGYVIGIVGLFFAGLALFWKNGNSLSKKV